MQQFIRKQKLTYGLGQFSCFFACIKHPISARQASEVVDRPFFLSQAATMAYKTGHDGKRRNDLPLAAISNCIQTHNDEVQDFRQGNQRKKVISARALMQI
jgi:hypothetical protein